MGETERERDGGWEREREGWREGEKTKTDRKNEENKR